MRTLINKLIRQKPRELLTVGIGLLGMFLLAYHASPHLGFQNGRRNGRNPTIPAPVIAAPAPPPAGTPDPDCSILVPAHPLSAQGLATPYQLYATFPQNGACDELNDAQSAFVQATILDPATGKVYVYNPLVINQGTAPALPPVVPTLPPHAVVAIWFGYNGNNLTQVGVGNSLQQGHCVNGDQNGIFGQYSYCNAPAFFEAADAAIASGKLVVPPLGQDHLGMTCPTVRDFFIVDQDQSDNTPVTYLVSVSGQLAQNTPANMTALPGYTKFGNPSDNGLTDRFVFPAIGCTPFTGTDLAYPAEMLPSQALNELQARSFQQTPVADVPVGDPMAQNNGATDLVKTNLYRQGVDQPLAWTAKQADTARYCRQMLRIAPPRLIQEEANLTAAPSPVAAAGTNLFAFMMGRFTASYGLLNCQGLLNLADPTLVTTDVNGVPTGGSFDMTVYNADIAAIASLTAADNAADVGPDIAKSGGSKGHTPFHGF